MHWGKSVSRQQMHTCIIFSSTFFISNRKFTRYYLSIWKNIYLKIEGKWSKYTLLSPSLSYPNASYPNFHIWEKFEPGFEPQASSFTRLSFTTELHSVHTTDQIQIFLNIDISSETTEKVTISIRRYSNMQV